MIHNLLIIKNGMCIYNYRTGNKSLEEDMISGLLEAIFGMGQIFFQKKIEKILFQECRTVFRALSKNIILGIVEDVDTDNEIAEKILKCVSKTLHQIILILERTVSPLIIKQIPWMKEELKYAFEKVLLKIPCPFLKKRFVGLLRGYSCTFIEKSIGRSPICNLYTSKNCQYLQDAQLWQKYRIPFKLQEGVQVNELVKRLGVWSKIEKHAFHVLNSNNTGTTVMGLRLKLKAYEIDASPKKVLGLMSKLEEKGFLTRVSTPIYEDH